MALALFPGHAWGADSRDIFPAYQKLTANPGIDLLGTGEVCAVDNNSSLTCPSGDSALALLAQSKPVKQVQSEFHSSSTGVVKHSCALSSTGSVSCWGSGPAAPSIAGAKAVVVSRGNSCAIMRRSVSCWGDWAADYSTAKKKTFPSITITMPRFSSPGKPTAFSEPVGDSLPVLATEDGILLQTDDGTFMSWKLNVRSLTQSFSSVKISGLPAGARVKQFAVYHSQSSANSPVCMVLVSRELYCGKLSSTAYPEQVTLQRTLTGVALPQGGTAQFSINSISGTSPGISIASWCAVGAVKLADRSNLVCSPANSLQNDLAFKRYQVRNIAMIPKSQSTIAPMSICAAMETGNIHCSGGKVINRGGIGSVRSLTAGSNHTCALNNFGEMYCWGRTGAADGRLYLTDAAINTLKCDQSGGINQIHCEGPIKTIASSGDRICATPTNTDSGVCWGVAPPASNIDASSSDYQWECSLLESKLVSCRAINIPLYGSVTCVSSASAIPTCTIANSISWTDVKNKSVTIPAGTTIPAGCTNTLRYNFCIGATSGLRSSKILRLNAPEIIQPAGMPLANSISSGRGQYLGKEAGHTCATTGSQSKPGNVYCWGLSEIGGSAPTALAAGFIHSGDTWSCALKVGGFTQCWGLNPPAISSATAFTSLVGGVHHVCGLSATGAVACRGSGEKSTNPDDLLVQSKLPSGINKVERKNVGLLKGKDFSGAILAGADLHGQDLTGTNLTEASLNGANLNGATLTGTNLTGANLTGADLTGAKLSGANLTGAKLTEADLSGTVISSSTLTGVVSGGIASSSPIITGDTGIRIQSGYLIGPGVNLSNCALEGINLSSANLVSANLSNSNLQRANLENSKLVTANLTGANLANSNLNGANLSLVEMLGARSGGITGTPASIDAGYAVAGGFLIGPGIDLSEATLTSINLNGVNLTGAILRGTKSSGLSGQPSAGGKVWKGLLLGPGVNLENADLSDADLRSIDLNGASLQGANLNGTDLRGVKWVNVNLGGADGQNIAIDAATDIAPWNVVAGILTRETSLQAMDLRNKDLSLTHFDDLSLKNLDLSGSKVRFLARADLSGTNLSGANLQTADLSEATLASTNLSSADLSGANLSAAGLTSVNMDGAIFSSNTKLQDASSEGITGNAVLPNGYKIIQGTLLAPGVSAQGMDLSEQDLSGVWLNNADLSCLVDDETKDVYCSNLQGAKLNSAKLQGANLGGADLSGVEWSSADLSGANLEGTTLTGSISKADITATGTILPEGWWVIAKRLWGDSAVVSNAALSGADLSVLNNAILNSMSTSSLSGTPSKLPAGWNIAGGTLIGPIKDLSKISNIGGMDISGWDLRGAKTGPMPGSGNPSKIPVGWTQVGRYLFGPQAKLQGANLSGLNLSGVNLQGVVSGEITGTPVLPSGWKLVQGYLVGPTANLSGAHLSYADLSNMNLSNATLTGAEIDNTNLNKTNLSAAVLTGVKASRFKPPVSAPQVPGSWKIVTGNKQSCGEMSYCRHLLGPGVDLEEEDLSGLDLTGVNLTGANLYHTRICDITQPPANMPSSSYKMVDTSDLTQCLLGPGVIIDQVLNLGDGNELPTNQLQRTWWIAKDAAVTGLFPANLSGVDLSGANLTGAVFEADGTSCCFDLSGADLSGATITNASFENADLGGISGRGMIGVPATLPHTPRTWKLLGSTLLAPGANLKGKSLQGADLSGIDLTGADLSGADLSGADLSGADLSDTNISGAKFTRGSKSGAVDAKLTHIQAQGVRGTALLPKDWQVFTNGEAATSDDYDSYLLGPQVDLRGASLAAFKISNISLREALLNGLKTDTTYISGVTLPEGWALASNGKKPTEQDYQGFLVGPGADLSNNDFSDIKLKGLKGAGGKEISLQGVISGGISSNKTTTWPTGWQLAGGYLFGPGSDLSGADLSDLQIKLGNISLSGAELGGANIRGVDFSRARLDGVHIDKVLTYDQFTRLPHFGYDDQEQVQGWKMARQACVDENLDPVEEVEEADYCTGLISGPEVNLSGADLGGIDFTDSDLSNAVLDGADLSDADLSTALFNGQGKGVKSNENTQLPIGWMIDEEGNLYLPSWEEEG